MMSSFLYVAISFLEDGNFATAVQVASKAAESEANCKIIVDVFEPTCPQSITERIANIPIDMCTNSRLVELMVKQINNDQVEQYNLKPFLLKAAQMGSISANLFWAFLILKNQDPTTWKKAFNMVHQWEASHPQARVICDFYHSHELASIKTPTDTLTYIRTHVDKQLIFDEPRTMTRLLDLLIFSSRSLEKSLCEEFAFDKLMDALKNSNSTREIDLFSWHFFQFFTLHYNTRGEQGEKMLQLYEAIKTIPFIVKTPTMESKFAVSCMEYVLETCYPQLNVKFQKVKEVALTMKINSFWIKSPLIAECFKIYESKKRLLTEILPEGFSPKRVFSQ
jgi:hypothetical protein